MLKAQSRKLKGALRHIRIDIVDTCNTLPHPADSNYSVMVRPKSYSTGDMFILNL